MGRLSIEVYTPHWVEARDFYLNHFDFRVMLETEGFVDLSSPHGDRLMFCIPQSPFVAEVFRPAFNGGGIIFQYEVEDVEGTYEYCLDKEVPIALALVDEPFNGKHFALKDPTGMIVDIVNIG